MKHLLIIYPHWPPSNLVGVHRVRLIANELVELGLKVTLLTVDERDYEEAHDESGLQLVDPRIQVLKVRAKPIRTILGKRAIGDIGLRGFRNLKTCAIQLCQDQAIDCAWISIPSWYPSLIGRHLHRAEIPFGIDYQDPWVHRHPENAGLFSRSRITISMARILEPIAMQHASFITGINQAYFEGAIQRNPHLRLLPQGELQLGFSHRDHNIPLPNLKSPWLSDHRVFIYAGAFLPLSRSLWKLFFEALSQLEKCGELDPNVRFYLFGTGVAPHGSLQELAAANGVEHLVCEYRERIPFLHVQEFMRRAEGVLSVGSVEPHYSASKIFQCLLSKKKLFSFFHSASEVRDILNRCNALQFHCDFNGGTSKENAIDGVSEKLANYLRASPTEWSPNLIPLESYSARKSAQRLLDTIAQIQSV